MKVGVDKYVRGWPIINMDCVVLENRRELPIAKISMSFIKFAPSQSKKTHIKDNYSFILVAPKNIKEHYARTLTYFEKSARPRETD